MENQKKKYTLNKSELLRLKRDFEALQKEGHAIFEKGIRLVYRKIPRDSTTNTATHDLMVAFIVPKKFHRTAVSRNLIKRRFREVHRLNKHPFVNSIKDQDFQFHLLFVVLSKKKYSFHGLKSIYLKLMNELLRKQISHSKIEDVISNSPDESTKN